MLRKLIETVATWLTKQLLDRWGAAIVSSAGLILLSILKGGRNLLGADYLVPGWALVLGVWLTLSLAGFVVVYQVQVWRGRQRQRRSQPTRFVSCGLRWRLTVNFWSTYQTFGADDMLVTGALLGPLCTGCERDVGDELRAGKMACANCAHTLNPTVPIQAENRPGIISKNNSDPLWPIRKAAYKDAQAKALRGELKR